MHGVVLGDGQELTAARVILCTGTFLRGLMHVGETRTRGGREGAASSEGLSGELRRLGLELRRLVRDDEAGDETPVAFSPDADDAFMFYGIACGAVDTEGFEIEQVLEDIESLNRKALEGALEGDRAVGLDLGELLPTLFEELLLARGRLGLAPVLGGRIDLGGRRCLGRWFGLGRLNLDGRLDGGGPQRLRQPDQQKGGRQHQKAPAG